MGKAAMGDMAPCQHCGRDFVLIDPQRRYCDDCRSRNLPLLATLKRRRSSDPKFIIRSAIHSSIHKALKATRQKKGGRLSEQILGYPIADLKRHLERQFLPGMTWDNHGTRGWHIDHIVPLKSFTFTGPDDPELRAAYALTNLRPLWAADNARKQGRRTLLV